MRTLIGLSLLFLTGVSQAFELKCVFTEPFLSVTYQPDNLRLLVQQATEDEPAVLAGVKFDWVNKNQIQILDQGNNTVLTVTHDNQGSDGMSDHIYPYSAVLTLPLWQGDKVQESALYGGCESNHFKKTETK